MKKVFYFLFVYVIISSNGISQVNWSIIDNASKWSVIRDYGGTYLTHFIKFDTIDTLINGTPYRKVYNTYDPYQQNWTFMNLFIRETSGGQVYLRDTGGDEDMIYDFSVVTGDTVTIRNILSGNNTTLIVDNVDSILINGEYRKQIHLDPVNWPYWDTWVEGVGSIEKGIIYSGWYNTTPWFIFLCYEYNNAVYYMNPYYTDCYYPVSIYEISRDDLKVSYDLAANRIEVKNTDKTSPVTFELYNFTGQKTLRKQLTGDFQISLSDYGLSGGIYIYSIKNGKHFVNGKLVISGK